MKNRIKIAMILGILLLVAIVIPNGPLQWYKFTFHVPNESRSILTSTDSPKELKERVGGLGIVMEFQDSQWLAIRYRDTHSGGIYSYALARLSDGSWLESSYHFCGAFASVSHHLAQAKALDNEIEGISEADRAEMRSDIIGFLESSEIKELAFANTIAEAKSALIDLGFTELK